MKSSEKYNLMIYVCHSFLEFRKSKLIYNNNSTVEDFRKSRVNNKICIQIGEEIENEFKYEVSWNQFDNAISWFLKTNKQ